MNQYRELVLGAGNSIKKRIVPHGCPEYFENATRIDIDPDTKPDCLLDLEHVAWGLETLPFGDNTFDEVHAYDVLEHIGQQGDWRGFFRLWSEIYRVMKKDALFVGICPSIKSRWLWGDPGHSRAYQPETLIFLSQRQYEQVGKTPMTDYRHVWKGDFELHYQNENEHSFAFVLAAIKP